MCCGSVNVQMCKVESVFEIGQTVAAVEMLHLALASKTKGMLIVLVQALDLI